jgi:hypothetical protein
MAQCKYLTNCPFFKETLEDMPAETELIKRTFCEDDYSKCARYMVFKALGAAKVPDYLFPRSVDVAKKLMEEEG